MKKHITVRELVEALSGLNQDALVVMTGWDGDCTHAFCENAVVSPTIQRRTSRHHPGKERYVLAPAGRLGDNFDPLLLEDQEEL